jgi:hypothetical protein
VCDRKDAGLPTKTEQTAQKKTFALFKKHLMENYIFSAYNFFIISSTLPCILELTLKNENKT